MLGLVLAAWLVAEDPEESGFGGAVVAPPDDEACVIRGDDGVWRSCADALALKKKPAPATEEPPPDPEQEKLRAAFAATAAAPPKKTKLEREYEEARLDTSLPLLQMRIDVARREEELAELANRGAAEARTAPLEKALGREREALEIVEGIALARLIDCAKSRGQPITFRNYRMTPGGPVYLSRQEIYAQLPRIDPIGCGRNELIDRSTVARARRWAELRATLAERDFGYRQLAERSALEQELRELEEELERQSLPGHGPRSRRGRR